MIFSVAIKDKFFIFIWFWYIIFIFFIYKAITSTLEFFADVIIPIIGSVFSVKYSPKQYLLFDFFLNAN